MTITINHLDAALKSAMIHPDGKYSVVDVFNRAQELAEANAQQEQYISAEEARKLGAGNAEWYEDYRKGWEVCDKDTFEEGCQYRAIKQPEPVIEDVSLADSIERAKAFYKPVRPTVMLTIDDEPAQMLTPEQCEAERLSLIGTHDLQFKSDSCVIKEGLASESRWFAFGNDNNEYRLIRKQPKVEMWCVNGVPIVPVGKKYDVFAKGTKTVVDMLVLSKAIEALITKEFV